LRNENLSFTLTSDALYNVYVILPKFYIRGIEHVHLFRVELMSVVFIGCITVKPII